MVLILVIKVPFHHSQSILTWIAFQCSLFRLSATKLSKLVHQMAFSLVLVISEA